MPKSQDFSFDWNLITLYKSIVYFASKQKCLQNYNCFSNKDKIKVSWIVKGNVN